MTLPGELRLNRKAVLRQAMFKPNKMKRDGDFDNRPARFGLTFIT
jgi:hypothetical protein